MQLTVSSGGTCRTTSACITETMGFFPFVPSGGGAGSIGSPLVAVTGTPAVGSEIGSTSSTAAAWGSAPSSSAPATPAGTASTTLVMMGLAVAFTPSGSGRVLVLVTGNLTNSSSSASMVAGPRFGTGTAPVNGAAVTGTRFGANADQPFGDALPTVGQGFAFAAVLTLIPATAYWFDMALSTSTNTGTLNSPGVTIAEL